MVEHASGRVRRSAGMTAIDVFQHKRDAARLCMGTHAFEKPDGVGLSLLVADPAAFAASQDDRREPVQGGRVDAVVRASTSRPRSRRAAARRSIRTFSVRASRRITREVQTPNAECGSHPARVFDRRLEQMRCQSLLQASPQRREGPLVGRQCTRRYLQSHRRRRDDSHRCDESTSRKSPVHCMSLSLPRCRTTVCAISPNGTTPSARRARMHTRSPNRMKPVLGSP